MKKYIIEIKLKKEKYARYYYDLFRDSFKFLSKQIAINLISVVIFIDFKRIDYFRIIEQGE